MERSIEKHKQNSLLHNTLFLYLLTFSNYIFGLIILPYETRVLGPESYGILGFAASFYTYFFVLFDFGFILCGTKLIAENSNDKKELGRIVTGITYVKFILFIFVSIIFFVICFNVDFLAQHVVVLTLYLIYAFITSLIPDYLYRGLENMKMITLRTVLVRTIFTCLIFVFLKQPDQYWLVPLFNIIGTLISLVWIYYDMRCNEGILLQKVMIKDMWSLMKTSSQFFISRVAATIYGASNIVILGFVYPSGNVLGYFTSADKIRSLGSQAASPIADSFYPYMLRTKNYSRMLKVTGIIELFIIVACIILWLYAEYFCVIVFGNEFRGATSILRHIIPLMAIILPSYMFGFPALSPMGKAKWANISVEIALINQIAGIILLFVLGKINVFSLINLTIISEVVCMSIRIWVFISGIIKK